MASYEEIITESVLAADDFGLPVLIEEAILLSADMGIVGSIVESLSTEDALLALGSTFHVTNDEIIQILESIQPLLAKPTSITEALTLSGVPLISIPAAAIVESLSLSEEVLAKGSIYRLHILQSIGLADKILLASAVQVSETTAFTGTTSASAKRLLKLAERLLITGIASNTMEAAVIASASIALTEIVYSGKGASLSDSVQLTGLLSGLALLVPVVFEQLLFTSIPSGQLTVLCSNEVTIEIGSSITPSAIFKNILSENLSFTVGFGLGDSSIVGYAMNTRNNALTQYDNFPFNSFTKIGETYYGASSSGLYALEGNTDDGDEILASATLGIMDFSGDSKTLLGDCFLAMRSDGEILLKIKSDDNVERWYKVSSTDGVLGDRRTKPAKGVKSRYWTFTLENIDGSDFEISELTIVPVALKRRLQ